MHDFFFSFGGNHSFFCILPGSYVPIYLPREFITIKRHCWEIILNDFFLIRLGVKINATNRIFIVIIESH